MRTKAAVCTLLALLLLAGSASAAQWSIEDGPNGARRRIAVGETVEVPFQGSYFLKIVLGNRRLKATCDVAGIEAARNTSTQALDEARAMSFFSCTEGVTIAPVMPWTGVLNGNGEPFVEPLGNVAFDLSLGGTDYGVFTGPLTAKFGDFDNPRHDEIDNTFTLKGNSGRLTNGAGGRLRFAGREKYGVKGEDTRLDGELNGEAEQTEEAPGREAAEKAEGDEDEPPLEEG
ncbi:MAG: hypothetical protein ACLQBB_00445 [Solirubrobacteraceae bacterium]